MRRLRRPDLSQESLEALAEAQRRLDEADAQGESPSAHWPGSSRAVKDAREEARQALEQMAGPSRRCMYCERGEGTDLEHFWPRSRYPERTFRWDNWLLACGRCNSNHKRDQFPLDELGAPLLLDPTQDNPPDHLRFTPASGELHGRTPRGETSVTLFDLNGKMRAGSLPADRVRVWNHLQVLLRQWINADRAGHHQDAMVIREILSLEPFPFLWDYLVAQAHGPHAELVLGEDIAALLRQPPWHPPLP